MSTNRELLVEWLNDAWAMEKAAIDILDRQQKRLESYPILYDRIRLHLDESRRQAEQVESLINRLGGSTSMVKAGVGRLMANVSVITNAMSEDEVIKNCLANFAFEHFEVASYRALVAAARRLNEPEVERVCSEILEQEVAMGTWLNENLPRLTDLYLEKRYVGLPSKH